MREELLNQTEFSQVVPKDPAVVQASVPVQPTQQKPPLKIILILAFVVGLLLLAVASVLIRQPKKTVQRVGTQTPLPTAVATPPSHLQEIVNNLEPVVKNADPLTNPNPFPPLDLRIRMTEPKEK